MTKSIQYFHEKQKNLPKNFAGERQKYLKLEKKNTRFSPRRGKIWSKKDKNQFITRGKERYFEKMSCQRSLESFRFLVYVIVVINSLPAKW